MRLANIHLDAATAIEVESRWLTSLASVLRAFLEERVPVGDLRAIFDGLRTSMQKQQSLVQAVEDIRGRDDLRWSLPGVEWNAHYLRLSERTEQVLRKRVRQIDGEALFVIEPVQTQDFLTALRQAIETKVPEGAPPIALLLADPGLRPHMRRLVELEFPNLPVVSEQELRREQITAIDTLDVWGNDE
jgi:flagellar biosynthesis component FlhA